MSSESLAAQYRKIAESDGKDYRRYLLAQSLITVFLQQAGELSVSLPHDDQFWDSVNDMRNELARVQALAIPRIASPT